MIVTSHQYSYYFQNYLMIVLTILDSNIFIKFKQMSSVLQAINLFPEIRFWRIKGQSQIQHTSGGLASLLLFVLIGIVLVQKLITVFQRNTILVTTDKTIHSNNALGTVTTSQNNPNIQPFMLGVESASGIYTLTMEHSLKGAISTISLEPCTVNHLHNVPDAQTIFNFNNFQNYQCLPLGQSFQIGGTATQISTLQLKLNCNNTALCSVTKLNAFISASEVNPQNSTHPWLSTLSTISYRYFNTFKTITYQLGQNTIDTNSAILPFQKGTTSTTGYILSDQVTIDETIIGNTGFQLTFVTSKKTFLYKRSFLTILDVISYIGGLFSTLLAAFCFMKIYGRVFYEMLYAKSYFKDKDTHSFGFFSFVKQSFYSLLRSCNCRPNWELAQKRYRIRSSVQKMMDVIYLQRRLEFIQNALKVLLEKHQLKGLHLLHKYTWKEINQNYQDHRLRRTIANHFINKKKKNNQNSDKISRKYSDDSLSGVIKQKKTDSASDLVHTNLNEKVEHTRMSAEKEKKLQKSDTSKLSKYDKKDEIVNQNDEYFEEQMSEESQPEQDEEENQNEIKQETKNHLARLYLEAQSNRGDVRSKRIVNMLDKSIREKLKLLQMKNHRPITIEFS